MYISKIVKYCYVIFIFKKNNNNNNNVKYVLKNSSKNYDNIYDSMRLYNTTSASGSGYLLNEGTTTITISSSTSSLKLTLYVM